MLADIDVALILGNYCLFQKSFALEVLRCCSQSWAGPSNTWKPAHNLVRRAAPHPSPPPGMWLNTLQKGKSPHFSDHPFSSCT